MVDELRQRSRTISMTSPAFIESVSSLRALRKVVPRNNMEDGGNADDVCLIELLMGEINVCYLSN